jgi:hypothetical protein
MSDFREFFGPSDIVEFITTSESYQNEGTEGVKVLRLFETTSQQTWLIATSRNLYCIVDDRRRPRAQLRWAMPLSEARAGPIRIHDAARQYRDQAGLLDIGRRRDWIYTKRLFRDKDVISAVRELIA